MISSAFEREGFIESGDSLNLPIRGLYCIEVEKLKQKTLEVLQRKIKTNMTFKHMNKSYQINPSFINLVVKKKEGGEGG